MPKLLMIDDDVNLLSYLGEELVEIGFQVTTLTNGNDAVVLTSREHFDLILLDMIMPDMDGIQVARLLKEKTPSTPIIGLTGYMGRDCITQAKELHLQMLTKPIVISTLVSLIKEVTK